MVNARIVLVGPKFEGNIGAVARSMANFGLDDLYLIDSCDIGDEAYRRAKHGSRVLENAKSAGTLEEAVDGCFLVVGTSSIVTKGEKNYARIPLSVSEFSDRINDYDEKVAILFGREDIGLLQSELSKCDILITIPASDSYPVLNVSHAAAIVMYELSRNSAPRPTPADTREKEQMLSFFDNLLDSIEYPEHRREATSIMFRRLMGRAVPTKWEYNTIMGVFGDATKAISKNIRKGH